MEGEKYLRLLHMSKVLSSPRRLVMLDLLAEEGRMRLGDIGKKLKMSNSLVSYHIKKLIQAGLVEVVNIPDMYGRAKPYYTASKLAEKLLKSFEGQPFLKGGSHD